MHPHLIRVRWHQHAHEFARLLEGTIAFHHHLINVAAINIADGPLDQIRFLINQSGRGGSQGSFADAVPKPQQIFAIALDFRLWPLRTGGAYNQRHALRQLQIIHHFTQPLAISGGSDLARNATTARGIGHQHAKAPGKRHIGCQRRALAAAFFLHNLHQNNLAPADHVLDFVMTHEARRDAALTAFFFRLGRAFAANGLGRGLVFFGGQFLNAAKIGLGGLIAGGFRRSAHAFAFNRERLSGGRGFRFRRVFCRSFSGGCRFAIRF